MPFDAKTLTANLGSIGSADLPLAGGKGASLGAMLGAGLPVPEGFAVLTQAYRDFVAHNGFDEPVRHLVEDVPADDPNALAEAAQALKDRFLAGAIPPLVSDAIAAAYAEIGAGLPLLLRHQFERIEVPGPRTAPIRGTAPAPGGGLLIYGPGRLLRLPEDGGCQRLWKWRE